MLHDVIVPLDGSSRAAVALGPASTMAHYLGTSVTVVGCYGDDEEKSELASVLPEQLRVLGGTAHRLVLEPAEDSAGGAVARIVAQSPGRLVCMTTRGRGRSAALLGSVAVDVLDQASGPLMLIGPDYRDGRFRCHGPLLVAVPPGDATRPGSYGRLVLPTAGAFGSTFDFELELDTVHNPYVGAAIDPTAAIALAEADQNLAGDLQLLAEELTTQMGRPVGHRLLKGRSVGRILVERAEETSAAAIAMATGNPTGLSRLLLGSVTGDVVRHAPCPVIVVHPH